MRISDWSSDVCSSDLEAFNIGARIEPDNYVPSELKSILHPELCEGSGEASETHDELIEKVARAAEVNGRKPTELMTRTLAQVSMLAATDFDLLTDAGRGKRLERSEEHTSELPSLMRRSYAVFC